MSSCLSNNVVRKSMALTIFVILFVGFMTWGVKLPFIIDDPLWWKFVMGIGLSGFISYPIDVLYRQKPWLIPGMNILWHKHRYTPHCVSCKNLLNTGEAENLLTCSCRKDITYLRLNGCPITLTEAREKVKEYLNKHRSAEYIPF